MPSSNEIRRKFIDYFVKNGHTEVSSSSLVPVDDPTLLFTNAGMNQFKDVFLGISKRDYSRAVTAQKCVRAGGKHNDLDTVGRTARHQTFFEMLGNFSFGDYFKREAIAYAWEFLTVELGLSPSNLWITVYKDDDEAFNLWQEVAGVPAERIIRLGEKDNFWAMGDTGPCGPCSEIHYDRGPSFRCSAPECAIGVCDCDRYMEIWNLVFMQYNRDDSGKITPLPRPSIDTGMGLERIASVLQGVNSNFETDLFVPIIRKIEEMTGFKYQPGPEGFPFRVVADHIRACSFLIADGVMPSNEGRGYVLRRILRRAVRFGKRLGMNEPFFHRLVGVVADVMGDAYPEVRTRRPFVEQVIRLEEERFYATLNDGLRKVEEIIARVKDGKETVISGSDAFMLYDTYGFPIDLTEDVAEEHGLTVDKAEFEVLMAEQRERGRKSFKAEDAFALEQAIAQILENRPATAFTGYQNLDGEHKVLALMQQGTEVQTAREGEAILVLDATPFYAESGGQVADRGTIKGPNGEMAVQDVIKVAEWIIHRGEITGSISVGQTVTARVEPALRQATAANHTATHLLHRALQEVLGEHAQQKGSLVEPERLRFDFSHFEALTEDELERIESLVNEKIWELLPVRTIETTLEEARKMGAMALFGEKYGEKVRVVEVEGFSRELCGGTHVKNTGEIGLFKIVSESSIGSGLRRIEALTRHRALEYLKKAEKDLQAVAALYRVAPGEVLNRTEALQRQLKETEKELEALKVNLDRAKAASVLDAARDINGVKVLIAQVEVSDMNSLRQNAEMLRDKLGKSVVLLGTRLGEKAGFVVFVSKELAAKGVHAGEIVGQVARVAGGGGGGRPDMAQAGGKDGSKVEEALRRGQEVIEEMLNSMD